MLELLDDVTDHVADLSEGVTAAAGDAIETVVDTVGVAKSNRRTLLSVVVVALLAALAVVAIRRATADATVDEAR